MSSASAPQHTKKPEKFHGGIVRVIDHKGGDYGGRTRDLSLPGVALLPLHCRCPEHNSSGISKAI